MSTIRLSLNQALEEVIETLEQAYKPMSRTEILKMAIAEFYNSRFGNGQIMNKTGKTTKQTKKKNIQIAKQIVEEGKELNISKDRIDDIMADYWEEEVQPGLSKFLAEKSKE